jgi:hypothetical protein
MRKKKTMRFGKKKKKNCLREENEKKKIEKETKLIGSEREEKKNCAIWKKKKSLKEENEKKIEKITKTEIESKKKKLCNLKEIESVGFENCVRFANSVRFEKKKKKI